MFARARSVPLGELTSWYWKAIGVARCARLDCEQPVDSVNHIIPRRGMGYQLGCHHHQSNLEPLCRPHHLEETRRQNGWERAEQEARRLDTAPMLPGFRESVGDN